MSDNKDDDDGAEGLSPDIMYDQTGDDAGKIVFTANPECTEFFCASLNLLFARVDITGAAGFDFFLRDVSSGDQIVFESEWGEISGHRGMYVRMPDQEIFVLGGKSYSYAYMRRILAAALDAYSPLKNCPPDAGSWEDVYWWTRIVDAGAAATPEPSVEPEPVAAAAPPARKPEKLNPVLRWALYAVLGFFTFSILSVAVHRFVPVPVTILMLQRLAEGEGLDHRWVSADNISPYLKSAVVAAEDAKFCTHAGFDFEAIEKAQKYNATHKKKRGASTISQQTAKNVFLWPSRSWVRKGFEVYYTGLIEALWSKDRILEVYLNSVEWGPGIYGAESASRYWFGKSARNLTRGEAARLAAILPSPRKWKAAKSGKYVQKRSGKIQAAARTFQNGGIDLCAAE
jgi:monofunctional glycosyltransferase